MSLNFLGKAFLGMLGASFATSLYEDVREESLLKELRSYTMRGKWELFNMTIDDIEDDDGNVYVVTYEDRCQLWLSLRGS